MNNQRHKYAPRTQEKIIEDLRVLVKSKGFIYALCMILTEDFHYIAEKLHETNFYNRLSVKEVSLLLGFLIQTQIDFAFPDSAEDLIKLKEKIYELMEELHQSFMIPFFDKLKTTVSQDHKIDDIRKGQKEFFGTADLLTEPIFYSGPGVYDFQYLDFLEKKYKYDKDWLIKHKNFNLKSSKEITLRIKNILQEKSQKVRFFNLKDRLPDEIEKLKKKYSKNYVDDEIKKMIPIMELYQYVDLFFENLPDDGLENFDLKKQGLEVFYINLVDLFIVRKSDFSKTKDIDSFLNNFALPMTNGLNKQFTTIGNFNLINAYPIIKIDEERYFVPLPFLLFEALYESPFYWMYQDNSYKNQLSFNRGTVGEEITFDILSKVFGKSRSFKSVKILAKKGQDVTDIDILCLLGSKALCVQVKSKKLTELARIGNEEQLKKDFKGAVQDAYDQGIKARKNILSGNAKFIDEFGNEIKLSEDIDEVFIIGVTTENYPSLTHQAHTLLEKNELDPFPLIITIFDLELIAHYLNNPYEFLYYTRQRTTLMDYFQADEEISFLGYHLDQKLCRIPEATFVQIENDFAKMIDRNYYPLKAGLKISDEGDQIKKRWYNENFERLCIEIIEIDSPKIIDVIFCLYDLSGTAREELVNLILGSKGKTKKDGSTHNFSMPLISPTSSNFGITYVSSDSDNFQLLKDRLIKLCELRKYKSKYDTWIGFGSYKSSKKMIDVVLFKVENWKFDKTLEEASTILKDDKIIFEQKMVGKKIGRNDYCPCGSGKKFKLCHGKK